MAGNKTYEYVLSLKDKMSKTMEKVSQKGGKAYSKLHKAQTKMNSLTRKFAPISNKAIGGVGVAAVSLFTTKMVQATSQTAQMVAEQQRLADRVGISTRSFTELAYAAKQYGVQQEAMRDGLKEMTMRADEFAKTGKGPAAEAMRRLGLDKQTVSDYKGNTEELFNLVQGKISQVQDTAARQRIADELLGGQAGEQMVEMLSASQEKLKQIRKEGKESGSIFGEQTGKMMVKYVNLQNELKASFRGLKIVLAKELIPLFSKYIKKLMGWIKANKQLIATKIKGFVSGVANAVQWLIDNMNWLKPTILSVVGAMVTLKLAALAVNGAMALFRIGTIAVTAATKIATAATWAFNVALKSVGIGWIIAGIAALTAGIIWLVKNWDKVTKAMKSAFDWMKRLIFGVWNWIKALGEKIAQFFKMVWYQITGKQDKAQEARMKMKGVKLGEQFQKGFETGRKNKLKKNIGGAYHFQNQEPKLPKINKIGAEYATKQPDKESPEGDGDTETATAIDSGGRKQTNINITLSNLVENMNISSEGFDESVEDMEEKMSSALLRVLNSANATTNG